MNSFHSIHSQHPQASAVIDDCAAQLEAAPAGYNLGFIYATDAMAGEYDMLVERCRQASGIPHWIGTLGIGIISDHEEHYDTPAASIMLAQFPQSEFAMIPRLTTAEEAAGLSSSFDSNIGLVHGDPYCEQAQAIIAGLATGLQHAFITGGLTSSQAEQLQLADDISSGGVSGVLFSGNIPIATNLSQGCSPVGDKHAITRAENNVLITLDDEPALEVVMRDTGADDLDELRARASDTFAGLCIPGSDRSDYTVRNIIGMDAAQRVLAINEYLTEGNELIFCRRDRESAVADMRDMLDNLARRIQGRPRGGLYVSCLGRGREQFGKDSEEIALIREVLGEFPLTGFFANGEIHHDKLYGYTGVLTLFL